MKKVKFSQPPKQPRSKADLIIEKAELISYGVFFGVAVFMTWSIRMDADSYFHLAFSILVVWVIILSIVQGVISHKKEGKYRWISVLLGCSQIATLCFCSYFCQDLLVVPALGVTLVTFGQTAPHQFGASKFILAAFLCAATSLPAQAKAAVVLLAVDFPFVLLRLARSLHASRKKGGTL